MAMSVIVIFKIFYPVLKEEAKYQISNQIQKIDKKENSEKKSIEVIADENFGIMIPKINASARIIADVDAQNSFVYQKALSEGVAHAKGTAYPGEGGNVFIFAHSSANILEANKYNAVFYLLSKLESGDEIFIYYQKQKFHYIVKEKLIVDPTETKYMNESSEEKLTLMTCWPPGTTMKRMIISAKPVSADN